MLRKSKVRLAAALVAWLWIAFVARADFLYVANAGNGTIGKVNPDGSVATFSTGFGTGLYGLAYDNAGGFYADISDAIFKIASEDLGVDYIVPSALDPRVAPAVAAAVAEAAGSDGVVRRHVAEVAGHEDR